MLSSGVNGLSRFSINWLIGRTAGATALGDFTSGLAVAQFMAILGPNSAGTAAAKFSAHSSLPDDDLALEARAASAHLTLRMLQLVPFIAAAAAALTYFSFRFSIAEASAVAVAVAGLATWALGRGVLYGRQDFGRACAVEVGLSMSSLAAVGIAMTGGMSGAELLLPAAGLHLIYGVFLVEPLINRRPLAPSVRKEIDVFVLYATAGTIASAGFLYIVQYSLRTLVGSEQSGLFAAAMTLSTPFLMVITAFNSVFYPRLSLLWRQKRFARYSSITDRISRIIASLILFPVVIVIVVAEGLTVLVWGNSFEGSGVLLQLFIVAVFAKGVSAVPVASLTAGPPNGMRVSAISSVLGSLIGVAALLVLVGPYGAVGAAVAYLVATIAISLIPVVIVSRTYNFRWSKNGLKYLFAILAALVISFADESVPIYAAVLGGAMIWLLVALPELKEVAATLFKSAR